MEDIRENGRILEDSIQHITEKAIKGKGLFKANSIILSTSATIGEHALILVDFLTNQRFSSLSVVEEFADRLLPKFVFYYFFKIKEWCLNNVNASSFPSVDMAQLRKVSFPIPPLEVQKEIIIILDAFKELTARKKQYSHYCGRLLDFGTPDNPKNEAEFKTLGEVCNSTKKATLKTSELKDDGIYPVVNSGKELYGYYNQYNNEGETIAIASRGEYAGFVSYFNEKIFAGGLCYPYKVKKDSSLLTKFLFYFLKTNENLIMENLVARGSIPALNKSDIEDFQVPIPPLEVQEKIVKILDKFESLTHDLQEGLPAEIQARTKQYEYYRNQLLTFKKLES